MATVQGPAKKGSVEKRTLHERMDKLFRISPIKVTARDGSGDKITIEHRVGREAGFLTRFELMDKLGLEDQFAEFVKEAQKLFRNEERLKEVCDDKYRILKSNMNRAVQDYRKHLESLYGNYPNRPLRPMFAFVKVNDKEDGLYLQGFVEVSSNKHMIGDPADNYAWAATVFHHTKSMADQNKLAEETAKALLLTPGLSKELRTAAHALSQGRIPDRLAFNSDKPDKK